MFLQVSVHPRGGAECTLAHWSLVPGPFLGVEVPHISVTDPVQKSPVPGLVQTGGREVPLASSPRSFPGKGTPQSGPRTRVPPLPSLEQDQDRDTSPPVPRQGYPFPLARTRTGIPPPCYDTPWTGYIGWSICHMSICQVYIIGLFAGSKIRRQNSTNFKM